MNVIEHPELHRDYDTVKELEFTYYIYTFLKFFKVKDTPFNWVIKFTRSETHVKVGLYMLWCLNITLKKTCLHKTLESNDWINFSIIQKQLIITDKVLAAISIFPVIWTFFALCQ